MSGTARTTRRTPPRRWLVALVVVLVLGGAGAAGVVHSRDGGTADSAVMTGSAGAGDASDADGDRAAAGDAGEAGADGDVATNRPEGVEPAAPEDGGSGAASGGGQGAEPGGGLGTLAAAESGRRLIREGSVTVGYPDTFDAAHRQVVDLAQQLGGGVRDLESTTRADGTVRGSVTVEVPVGEYDALLDGVADVGRVRRRDVRTEDVTEQYVDLESRLRHLERTEQFYLDLFDRAESVDDVIRVRDRLDSVQQRIEQIQGRLRHLEHRTEMSRLTVDLVPAEAELDDGTPVAAGFGRYWADARAAFVGVAGTLLVAAVGGAPLALVTAVVVALVVALLRARRSTRTASAAQPE